MPEGPARGLEPDIGRATGWAAIQLAAEDDGIVRDLRSYASPLDDCRTVTVEEAREIAAEDPSLIYVIGDRAKAREACRLAIEAAREETPAVDVTTPESRAAFAMFGR